MKNEKPEEISEKPQEEKVSEPTNNELENEATTPTEIDDSEIEAAAEAAVKAELELEKEVEKSENKTTVVANKSRADNEKFSYTYSNLADIANAGVDIPEMRIKPTEYGEYIEYKDEKGEWQLGAKIVELGTTKMNPAQAYGAALTYARRYTTMLAKKVACNDDDQIENKNNFVGGTQNKASYNKSSQGWSGKGNRVDFSEVRNKIQTIATTEELTKYWNELKLSQKQQAILKPDFTKRREEIEGAQ